MSFYSAPDDSEFPTLDITQPDNPADTIINLRISGNRLVAICNAAQALMYQHDKLEHKAYRELYVAVERVRDQLSEQRCAKREG